MQKIIEKLRISVNYLFILISFGIFTLCMVSYWIPYAYKLDVSNNNWVILFCALMIFGVWLYILTKLLRKHQKYQIWLIIISIILLVVQVKMVSLYYFRTAWDAKTVSVAAEILTQRGPLDNWYHEYFSYYPNNILPMLVLQTIMEFGRLIGQIERIFVLALFSLSVINVLTGYLTFKVIYKMTNNLLLSWVGYSFYFVILWLSPWVSIPYSDSLGLIIPISLFYVYLSLSNNRY